MVVDHEDSQVCIQNADRADEYIHWSPMPYARGEIHCFFQPTIEVNLRLIS